MKKRLLLLLGLFVACYYLLHIAYDLPYLVNGSARFIWLPLNSRQLLWRLVEIGAGSLFALCPYLILCYGYPRYKWICLVAIILCLPLIFELQYGLALLLQNNALRLRHFFLANVSFFLLYAVFGITFYFIRYTLYKELQQKELYLQQRQSELSFLRSQINPHFLFNSLNNIYALVYHASPKALNAIAGLSELLRYMLYDATEKVPVDRELDYIRKYIELQRLRFEQPITANMQVTGDTSTVMIPPLLLVPFVENAFKHGDFSREGTGLSLTLHSAGKKMYFHCYNQKGKQLRDAAGGIGLDNVKRRLNLLYPGKHLLVIDENDGHFSVNLELLDD